MGCGSTAGSPDRWQRRRRRRRRRRLLLMPRLRTAGRCIPTSTQTCERQSSIRSHPTVSLPFSPLVLFFPVHALLTNIPLAMFGAGAPKCPRCSKSVYEAEEVRAAGKRFHVQCFTCHDCHTRLNSTTLCDKNDEVYCSACYAKNFGPKVHPPHTQRKHSARDVQSASAQPSPLVHPADRSAATICAAGRASASAVCPCTRARAWPTARAGRVEPRTRAPSSAARAARPRERRPPRRRPPPRPALRPRRRRRWFGPRPRR